MMTVRYILLISAFVFFFAGDAAAQQQRDPKLPPPIQTLQDEGAQIRYLGRDLGMDGWIAIKGGKEQYFYATPDGKAIVLGLLFDADGKIVTMRQVKELQDKSGDVLGFLAEELPERADAADRFSKLPSTEFKTPSEQMFDDVAASNWIPLGKEGAPVIYSFMDPQCPHCHAFMKDIKANYIDNGLIQVRMIPVGFKEQSKAQAAFLLAAPVPQDRWYKHLEGDETALPASPQINQQGVERNMAVMQSWKLDVTPLTVYRSRDGGVKIVQGRPQNIPALLADLPPAGAPLR